MQQKHYELTYIISTAIPETDHPEIKDKVTKILETHGAKITQQEDLGKKKFTYAIQKVRHGFYQVVEFDCQPQKIKAISEDLKLYNQVLRFLLVHKKQLSEEVKQKQAQTREARKKHQAEQAQKEKQAEQEKQREQESKQAVQSEEKVDLEDLDKKLDEIIEGDDLID